MDFGFGFIDRSIGKVINGYDIVVEIFFVSKIFGFGKFVFVMLRLNFEFSIEDFGGYVVVFGSFEYGNRIDGSLFGFDFVYFGFFVEVYKGLVVIRGVGWDRSNNIGILFKKKKY